MCVRRVCVCVCARVYQFVHNIYMLHMHRRLLANCSLLLFDEAVDDNDVRRPQECRMLQAAHALGLASLFPRNVRPVTC